jgi:hypothetical protein
MQWLNGKRVVVTGGSQGLGLAMVKALVASGANVTAMSRDPSNLKAAAEVGASVIAGDATDATLMNALVRDEAPDVLILNAGTRLPIKPIDQQGWEEFSMVWNTDEGRTGRHSGRTEYSDETRRTHSGDVERCIDGACGSVHQARRPEPLWRLRRR